MNARLPPPVLAWAATALLATGASAAAGVIALPFGQAAVSGPPLIRAQGVDVTGRIAQFPRPADSAAPFPGSQGTLPYGYGPYAPYGPYGPYGPPPQQQSQPQQPPCPDIGSTAVVERARPRGARSGPLVAMPSNDCADLPGRTTIQPYIGVDVQVTPPGFGSDAGGGGGIGGTRPVFPVQPIVPHRPRY